jgi:CheY-like chemotaxis protein
MPESLACSISFKRRLPLKSLTKTAASRQSQRSARTSERHDACEFSRKAIELIMTVLLLVDDDVDNLHALRNVIEAAGYEVVSAIDGVDAIEKLRAFNPRMVITDWQMPNMDGWALCQRVRSLPQSAGVPVILLSANVQPVEPTGCWSAFFRKPANLDALLACITKLCSTSRTSRGAFLAGVGPASSRWQGLDSRCWP